MRTDARTSSRWASSLSDIEVRAEHQPLVGEHRPLLVATDVDRIGEVGDPVPVYLSVVAHSLQLALHEIHSPHVRRIIQGEWSPALVVSRIRISEELQPLEDVESINQAGAVQCAVFYGIR